MSFSLCPRPIGFYYSTNLGKLLYILSINLIKHAKNIYLNMLTIIRTLIKIKKEKDLLEPKTPLVLPPIYKLFSNSASSSTFQRATQVCGLQRCTHQSQNSTARLRLECTDILPLVLALANTSKLLTRGSSS